MKKTIIKCISYIVLINSVLGVVPMWAVTEMTTEISNERTDTSIDSAVLAEKTSSESEETMKEQNTEIQADEIESSQTSEPLGTSLENENASKEENMLDLAETSDSATVTNGKIEVDLDKNWYEIERGAQTGYFETENGAQYGFRGMGVQGYKVNEQNPQAAYKGYMDFAASYQRRSYLMDSNKSESENFQDKGTVLYVNGKNITGESSAETLDSSGITRWQYQRNKETHFYKNDVTHQLYATMIDPEWQIEYTLTINVDVEKNDAMYYWHFYNTSEKTVTMAALQTSYMQNWGIQRIIGGNGGGGFLEKYGSSAQNIWFITRFMDENNHYYTDFNKYYLGYWGSVEKNNQFGNNFDKKGSNYVEGTKLTYQGGYQLGTDRKEIQPNQSLCVGEKISFGPRATEAEVRKRFSLEESAGWEALTPGSSKDGYIETRSGIQYGFRGMGVTDYEADIPIGVHDGNGYLDFAVSSKDGLSYVFSKENNHTNRSIIPFLNKELIGNNGKKDLVDKGVTNQYYQKDQSAQYFINRKEAKLFGVMYTQDQITMILTIDVDVRNDTADYAWNFINERNSAVDIGVIETVDTAIGDNDANDIVALGKNQGLSLEDGNHGFIVQFADINGHWKTDFNKFYAGNYATLKNTNMFGNNFDKVGMEVNNDDQGTVYDGANDTAYQLGTDLHNLKNGQSISVGSNVYFGEKRSSPLLVGQLFVGGFLEDKDVEQRDSGQYYLDEKNKLWLLSTLSDKEDLEMDWTLYAAFNDEEYEKIGVLSPVNEGGSADRSLGFKVDEEKLANLNGQDKLHLVAEAPGSRKTERITQTLTLVTISGEPQVAAIPLGSDLLEEKELDDLVKNLTIVHTEPQPLYSYLDKAPDTSKIGFTKSDIRISDPLTPKEHFGDVTIPVSVYNKETTIWDSEKLLALDSKNSIRIFPETASEYLKNPSENSQLLTDPAEIQAWSMSDGTDLSKSVTIEKTNLSAQDGEYTADLAIAYDGQQIEKKITIVVKTGVTVFQNVPNDIEFETTKVQSKEWLVPIADNPSITIENTAKKSWELYLYSSTFTDSTGRDVGYLLDGSDANRPIAIDKVEGNQNTPDIYTVPLELNLRVPPRTVFPKATYTAEFDWVLVVGDPTN